MDIIIYHILADVVVYSANLFVVGFVPYIQLLQQRVHRQIQLLFLLQRGVVRRGDGEGVVDLAAGGVISVGCFGASMLPDHIVAFLWVAGVGQRQAPGSVEDVHAPIVRGTDADRIILHPVFYVFPDLQCSLFQSQIVGRGRSADSPGNNGSDCGKHKQQRENFSEMTHRIPSVWLFLRKVYAIPTCPVNKRMPGRQFGRFITFRLRHRGSVLRVECMGVSGNCFPSREFVAFPRKP